MQVSGSARRARNLANLDQCRQPMRNAGQEIRLNRHAELELRMAGDLILKLGSFAVLIGVFVYAFVINL
jgi:hypothetical protein